MSARAMCKPPPESPATVAPPKTATVVKTPFPWRRMLCLLLVTLADGLTITLVMPIAPDMVRSFGIAEVDVGSSAGMLASCYNLAQLFSNIILGRLSDIVGRKPVIAVGLVGACASLVLLGLADSLALAMAARLFGGLVNATQAIMRAWLAELFLEEHKAKAFASLGQAWGVGFLVGPLLGGGLSHPAVYFPDALRGTMLETRPFLLACCTGMLPSILGLIALSRLPETVKRKGSSSSSTTRTSSSSSSSIELEEAPAVGKAGDVDAYPTLDEPAPEAAHSNLMAGGGQGRHCCTRGAFRRWLRRTCSETASAFSGLRKTSIRIAISLSAMNHFHVIGMAELFPLYATSPYALRLEPHQVALALAPLATMLLTWPFVFVRLERVYGCVVTLRIGMSAFILVSIGLPALWLTRDHQVLMWVGLVLVGLLRGIGGNSCFPSLTLLLNSLLTDNLGAMNGLNASVGSGMRAISPIVCGSLFSAATAMSGAPYAVGLPFLLNGLLPICSLCLTMKLPSFKPGSR